MRNKFITVFILLCIGINFAYANNFPEITYLKFGTKFSIFNAKNNKIIKYFLLLPKKEIKFRTSNVDSLRIYSRLILEGTEIIDYRYSIKINDDEKKIIRKSAKLSNVSKGLGGEKISTFNKYICRLDSKNNSIIIRNLSKEKLLIKIRDNIAKTKNNEVEFVAFTPQLYSDEKILIINDKEYTYYIPQSKSIELTLEGPILLKIISRLVFDNLVIKKYNYRFDLYDNGKLLTSFQEKAYKSIKAVFADDKDKIPSTGDVNVIKFSNGLHQIVVKNCDQNRDLIFRFYINKTAVK